MGIGASTEDSVKKQYLGSEFNRKYMPNTTVLEERVKPVTKTVTPAPVPAPAAAAPAPVSSGGSSKKRRKTKKRSKRGKNKTSSKK
jgi:hypothetical protein